MSTTVRRALLLAGFGCALLAAGWSAYWYIAQRMAMSTLDAQLNREAGLGRLWSCDFLSSGGYPLSVSIDCIRPQLRFEDTNRSISAQRARIGASLFAPKLVSIDLTGPARLVDDVASLSLEWASMRIDARGLPERLDRLSVTGRELVVDRAATGTKIATLEAHLRRTSPAPMAPYALTLGLGGVDSPEIQRIAGRGGPALLTLLGTVTQLDSARSGQWFERLEDWRRAGGLWTISALNLSRDDFSMQAEGALGLDQRHRPEGQLALRLHNAGPALLAIAEATGKLRPNTLAWQLAAGVLGRPGELRFDASAENGMLSVGPLRQLLALPPLY